uniref:Uncharacterized protein n=1 Tax=Zooxanthella nutricula TaxID=1333877 RepID=A0A6U8UG61_9DINO|mmetsp:Transcript_49087/g.149444  ORF Transcript_49087/g.149444 Transcript_49087/m.149444 type:complete len:116 (+) Transcript_49087:48-395(+)
MSIIRRAVLVLVGIAAAAASAPSHVQAGAEAAGPAAVRAAVGRHGTARGGFLGAGRDVAASAAEDRECNNKCSILCINNSKKAAAGFKACRWPAGGMNQPGVDCYDNCDGMERVP